MSIEHCIDAHNHKLSEATFESILVTAVPREVIPYLIKTNFLIESLESVTLFV